MKQHVKPCKECPFRRASMPGWLGRNDPAEFAVMANHDVMMPCHLTTGTGKTEWHCAGRAIMWANQCKVPRDDSVPLLRPDRANVFSTVMEFVAHHRIVVTILQLMGVEAL
jgi:hypothetical protein